MSEYWKSIPKYWCKHCKTHVRDTPLEKRNHESTPRHQGNISRFLKELHRNNERDARNAQRAKDEAARLNGLTPSVAGRSAPLHSSGSGGIPQAKLTPDDRKRQLAQLAAMGVAVPDEYRRENAMAGEWQSVEQRPAMPLGARRVLGESAKVEPTDGVKKEEEADGVGEEDRKRPLEDDHEGGVGFGFKNKRKPKWGTDVKTYKSGGDDELDSLLDSTTVVRKATTQEIEATPDVPSRKVVPKVEEPTVKDEDETATKVTDIPTVQEAQATTKSAEVKAEDEDLDVGSIFKKRKAILKR